MKVAANSLPPRTLELGYFFVGFTWFFWWAAILGRGYFRGYF